MGRIELAVIDLTSIFEVDLGRLGIFIGGSQHLKSFIIILIEVLEIVTNYPMSAYCMLDTSLIQRSNYLHSCSQDEISKVLSKVNYFATKSDLYCSTNDHHCSFAISELHFNTSPPLSSIKVWIPAAAYTYLSFSPVNFWSLPISYQGT